MAIAVRPENVRRVIIGEQEKKIGITIGCKQPRYEDGRNTGPEESPAIHLHILECPRKPSSASRFGKTGVDSTLRWVQTTVMLDKIDYRASLKVERIVNWSFAIRCGCKKAKIASLHAD